jgi:hypothetical protein
MQTGGYGGRRGRPRRLTQCHLACPVARFPGVPFPPGQQVKPGILRCQEPGSGSLRVVIPPMAQCHSACPVARFPGVPFPPGQQVKPGILRCQEPDFGSLWVVIPPMAGFLAHDNDRHPAYARFARFYPGRDSGRGPGLALTPAAGPQAKRHCPMAGFSAHDNDRHPAYARFCPGWDRGRGIGLTFAPAAGAQAKRHCRTTAKVEGHGVRRVNECRIPGERFCPGPG